MLNLLIRSPERICHLFLKKKSEREEKKERKIATGYANHYLQDYVHSVRKKNIYNN